MVTLVINYYLLLLLFTKNPPISSRSVDDKIMFCLQINKKILFMHR